MAPKDYDWGGQERRRPVRTDRRDATRYEMKPGGELVSVDRRKHEHNKLKNND